MLLKTDLQLVVLILFSITKSFQNLKLICLTNDVAEKNSFRSCFQFCISRQHIRVKEAEKFRCSAWLISKVTTINTRNC